MITRKNEFKLERVSFRVDPRYLDKFKAQCEKQGVTKSEAIRTLFNQHIIMPPVQANQNTKTNNVI